MWISLLRSRVFWFVLLLSFQTWRRLFSDAWFVITPPWLVLIVVVSLSQLNVLANNASRITPCRWSTIAAYSPISRYVACRKHQVRFVQSNLACSQVFLYWQYNRFHPGWSDTANSVHLFVWWSCGCRKTRWSVSGASQPYWMWHALVRDPLY